MKISKENDVIEKIKINLSTKYMGRNIIYFETIDSTQKKAKELAKNKVQNGTLVLANMQTHGVGTHGRVWHTEPNSNILMTLVLYPNCNIDKLNTITIDIANCLVKVIKNLYKIQLSIKEPNDLILNGRKIGGILTETKLNKEFVDVLFIGIGFNVNQEKFPEEINEIATSLKKEFKKDFEREKIVAEFLNRLENVVQFN
ncbi:MAG: biotin--[acetyl-CoA-carboxylase] ligase [Oscillospiraceae bacterium]|nr:biotin--[acetyl-CoA-carboxylase] ligase [Oscillospiraceae bacterium]